MVYKLQTGQEVESNQFKIAKECPLDVTKDQAYFDLIQPVENQLGLLHCWCYDQLFTKVN